MLGEAGALAGPVYKSRKMISRDRNEQELTLSRMKASGLGTVRECKILQNLRDLGGSECMYLLVLERGKTWYRLEHNWSWLESYRRLFLP